MNDDRIEKLKQIGWPTILHFCRWAGWSLNDRHNRFLKGYLVEKSIEYHENVGLKYVNLEICDFDWPSEDTTIEVKSNLTSTLFTKSNRLRKTYAFKLMNSNGTNSDSKHEKLFLPDFVLGVKEDGVFLVPREVMQKDGRLIKTGDGAEVKVDSSEIIPLTDKITFEESSNVDLNKMVIRFMVSSLEYHYRFIDPNGLRLNPETDHTENTKLFELFLRATNQYPLNRITSCDSENTANTANIVIR